MAMDYFEQADKQITKAIQKATEAVPDGYFGQQALLNLFLKLVDYKSMLPFSYQMYGGYALFGNPKEIDLEECKNKAVRSYKMAGSGAFQWKNSVVSLLVNNGAVINNTTSKTWANKRVSTLFYTFDGKFGLRKVLYASELPKNTKWAISGVGLVSNVPNFYHPDWEGFVGKFADVLETRNHAVFGFKEDGTVVYFLQPSCSMKKLMWLAKEVYGLKFAISLDGGHIPAIQSDKFSFNKSQIQNNVVIFRR
jgi:hypothetical protein